MTWRRPSAHEALSAVTKPNLRRVGEIAYTNPARNCGCANASVVGGASCPQCGTYLHGPACRVGCVCSPEIWRRVR